MTVCSRLVCFVTLLFLPGVAGADEQSLPPGGQPVEVACGIFLGNLSAIAERSETFNADLYLSFRWRDARLAFVATNETVPGGARGRAAGRNVVAGARVVNTAAPGVTNRALKSRRRWVRYELGVRGDYGRTRSAPVSLRPPDADRPHSIVHLDGRPDGVRPRPDADQIEPRAHVRRGVGRPAYDRRGWAEDPRLDDSRFVLRARRLDRRGTERSVFRLDGLRADVLIFLVSCTSFIVPITDFSGRIGISLTALLACIATQFAMNFDLPGSPT